MQLTVIRYGSPSGLRQGWSPGRSGRSSNDSFGTLNVLTEFTHEIVSLIMSAILLIIFFFFISVYGVQCVMYADIDLAPRDGCEAWSRQL